MKKTLLLFTAIFIASCSSDSVTITEQTPTQNEPQFKNYNNLVYLDATFDRFNMNGDNLPVTNTDQVTIFEKTTFINITPTTFETNNIQSSAFVKNGYTYSLPNGNQFTIYEDSKIIFKKVEYNTSYGHDKRVERYSY